MPRQKTYPTEQELAVPQSLSIDAPYETLLRDPGRKSEIALFALLMFTKWTPNKNYPMDFVPDIKNVDDLEQSYINYLKLCFQTNKLPSREAAAEWMGVSVSTLYDWNRGKYGTKEQQDLGRRVRMNLSSLRQQAMDEKIVHFLPGTFEQKVHDGYVEEGNKQITITHETKNVLEVRYNEDERRKYLDEKIAAGLIADKSEVVAVIESGSSDDF